MCHWSRAYFPTNKLWCYSFRISFQNRTKQNRVESACVLELARPQFYSDTTEQLRFHFSVSCIGEGNGNPLQCSCLENPRDGEPGGLPSMGSHRVGHDWSDLAAVAAAAVLFQVLPPLSVIKNMLTVNPHLTIFPFISMIIDVSFNQMVWVRLATRGVCHSLNYLLWDLELDIFLFPHS